MTRVVLARRAALVGARSAQSLAGGRHDRSAPDKDGERDDSQPGDHRREYMGERTHDADRRHS